MMKASAASGNAVLAKARALYGRRLRADDYRRLMGCRTMTELAAALKEYPLYADALAEVNPQYARRAQLENLLRNAEVIDEDVLKMDVVNLGSKVTVLDVEFDEEMEYTIVGSTEADPMNGRISNESPLGMALLGQKVGATVMADTPDGEVAFKILNIQK